MIAERSVRPWLVCMLLFGLTQHTFEAEGHDPAVNRHHITISSFEFRPSTIRARPGDIITWRNEDVVPHSIVRSEDAKNLSVVLAHGDTFTYIVGSTMNYECGLHSPMKGVVIVLP